MGMVEREGPAGTPSLITSLRVHQKVVAALSLDKLIFFY